MESKRQFKCAWVNDQLKEEKELVLYPNKDGLVSDLLSEAREQIDCPLRGSGKLRLLEIISAKVFNTVCDDMPLEHLMIQTQRSFRVEVCPCTPLVYQERQVLMVFCFGMGWNGMHGVELYLAGLVG